MTTRRSFLTACIATVAAPAIVRASSLMPVKVRRHWMEGIPINQWLYSPALNAPLLSGQNGLWIFPFDVEMTVETTIHANGNYEQTIYSNEPIKLPIWLNPNR